MKVARSKYPWPPHLVRLNEASPVKVASSELGAPKWKSAPLNEASPVKVARSNGRCPVKVA